MHEHHHTAQQQRDQEGEDQCIGEDGALEFGRICPGVLAHVIVLIEYFILRKVKILYRTIGGMGKKMEKPSLKDPELFENLREQVQLFRDEKTI